MVNTSSVRAELQQQCRGTLDAETIEAHTQKICGGAAAGGRHVPSMKKIFAILVLCEMLPAITRFISEDVTDRDLPLRKVPRRGGVRSRRNMFSLCRRGDRQGAARPLGCFDDWSALATIKFEEWQWTTLAPFFHRSRRGNVGHFTFQDQIPLPFTADSRYGYGDEEEDGDEGSVTSPDEVEGGFSSVFRVDIHPQHHGFGGYKVIMQHISVRKY